MPSKSTEFRVSLDRLLGLEAVENNSKPGSNLGHGRPRGALMRRFKVLNILEKIGGPRMSTNVDYPCLWA